jgi:hypothetical protein
MNADISRHNPTCFLFLIDQSHSMAQRFGDRSEGPGVTKALAVADALNDLLRNLIITCSKADGVRNYLDVGVIGYGETVGPAWAGPLAGQYLVPIREVASGFKDILDRSAENTDSFGQSGGKSSKFPVWVEPRASGSTPMCEALTLAHQLLQGYVMRNFNCFPPTVVHITDGEATDGNPSRIMNAITDLTSSGGNVTLINVHLSSSRDALPTSFPDSPEGLPNDFARLLFDRASYLSPFMQSVAHTNGLSLSPAARAFVLNADPSLMVLALEIGTRPGNMW